MKTKTETKKRKELRDFQLANQDLRKEFGTVMQSRDVLDETELAECLEDDDYNNFMMGL